MTSPNSIIAQWLIGKESVCNAEDVEHEFDPWIRFPGGGNGNPLQYSCLENSMDGGAWQVTVHGVTKSRDRLSDLAHTAYFLFIT